MNYNNELQIFINLEELFLSDLCFKECVMHFF